MSKKTKEIKLTPLYFNYVLGSEYDAIVEIGGRYSGKSYNSQIEEAANLASKKDYKLLIIQDLDKGGSDGYYAGLVDKIEQFGHTPAYNITTSSTKITNTINGNSVLFRGYKTDQQKKDVKNIDQVTKIVVEEGEWMTFDDFLALIQQLRGKVESDRRLDILLNPVNEYCFANTELVEKPPDKVLEYFPNSNRPKVFERHFKVDTVDEEGKEIQLSINVLVVLSTHFDNPNLNGIQRAAIEIYKKTDPDKYKQLGEARFIKSGGVYFNEFERHIHVVEPFVIPEYWRRYFVMDYGLDMLAGYWIALSDNNKAFFYKEVYKSDLIISDAAKEIRKLTNESIHQYFAPPDMWNRRQETGKSAAEIFVDNGIRFTKTNNNRVQGWLNVKEWMKPFEDEQGILTANVQIFSNCTNLIRCLSQIKRSERDPNDVANEPHELTHAPDAFRGFFAGRPSPNAKLNVRHQPENFLFTDYTNTGGGLQEW
jgi:phage terminase large subunit